MSDTLAAIRAQRAEVEALIAYRHAIEGETRCLAWWRLHHARMARLPLLGQTERVSLPPLPPPPMGALGRIQALRLRFGLLSLDRAAPPASVARRLQA